MEEQQGCGRNYGDVRQHYQKAVKITRQIADQRECHRIAPSASGCSGVSHPTRDGARQNEVVDHAEPVEQGKQQSKVMIADSSLWTIRAYQSERDALARNIYLIMMEFFARGGTFCKNLKISRDLTF